MIPARIALLAGLLALVVPAAGLAAESPFDPFRRLLQRPSATMKQVIGAPTRHARAPAKEEIAPGDTAVDAATPATVAAPAEPKQAATPPAEPVATAAEPAAVPVPRIRPMFSDIAARIDDATLPAPASIVAEEKAAEAAAPLALTEPEPEPDRKRPPDIIIPDPQPRPDFTAAAPDAPPKKARATGKLASLSPDAGEMKGASCAQSLASLGIEATPLAPIHEGTCGVAAPAAVASLDNGAVDFSEKAIINCATAGALAKWMSDDVQPEAERLLGGRVTGLRIAASYICRGRNNVAGAQLSEHAFGNAIDIAAFRVAGRWVEVGNTKAPAEADFLRAIRKEACGPFTTVLGPGVAYHDTHFHLDLARRRSAGPSKGLYCR